MAARAGPDDQHPLPAGRPPPGAHLAAQRGRGRRRRRTHRWMARRPGRAAAAGADHRAGRPGGLLAGADQGLPSQPAQTPLHPGRRLRPYARPAIRRPDVAHRPGWVAIRGPGRRPGLGPVRTPRLHRHRRHCHHGLRGQPRHRTVRRPGRPAVDPAGRATAHGALPGPGHAAAVRPSPDCPSYRSALPAGPPADDRAGPGQRIAAGRQPAGRPVRRRAAGQLASARHHRPARGRARQRAAAGPDRRLGVHAGGRPHDLDRLHVRALRPGAGHRGPQPGGAAHPGPSRRRAVLVGIPGPAVAAKAERQHKPPLPARRRHAPADPGLRRAGPHRDR